MGHETRSPGVWVAYTTDYRKFCSVRVFPTEVEALRYALNNLHDGRVRHLPFGVGLEDVD